MAEEHLSLSNKSDDPREFIKLSDDFIMKSLQFSDNPNLVQSKMIMQRIVKRDLYKLVCIIEDADKIEISPKEVEKVINEIASRDENNSVPLNDLTVIRRKISMPSSMGNCIKGVHLFEKNGKRSFFNFGRDMEEQRRNFKSSHLC